MELAGLGGRDVGGDGINLHTNMKNNVIMNNYALRLYNGEGVAPGLTPHPFGVLMLDAVSNWGLNRALVAILGRRRFPPFA